MPGSMPSTCTGSRKNATCQRHGDRMGLCGAHCGQNWIGSQGSSSEALFVMLSGLELNLKVGHWEEAGESHYSRSYMEE